MGFLWGVLKSNYSIYSKMIKHLINFYSEMNEVKKEIVLIYFTDELCCFKLIYTSIYGRLRKYVFAFIYYSDKCMCMLLIYINIYIYIYIYIYYIY